MGELVVKGEVWIRWKGYWISSDGLVENRHGKVLKVTNGVINLGRKVYRMKNLIGGLFLGAEKGSWVKMLDKAGGYGISHLEVVKKRLFHN